MKGRNLADLLVALAYVAVVLVLVRPQSQASQAVKDLSNLFAAVVHTATDI